MPVYYDTFSDRPAFQLQLHIVPGTPNQAGNYTDVAWGLYIVETYQYGSYSFSAGPWTANVHASSWNGSATYDFRPSGVQTLTLGGGSARVYHDANGYATVGFNASYGGNTTIGTASVSSSLALTRIPKVPGAPLISGTVGGTTLGVSEVKTTSARVIFSGTSDGGSTITGWEIQYAEDAAFTVNPQTWASSGNSVITGLKSGVTYYFRARGKNAIGWGAYSATASARTLTALYVSDGTTWSTAEVYVSDGTTWQTAEIFISDGLDWLTAD